ncbi:Rv3212 family protein [Nakamurella leprariae]|uniref:Uncharacterized protein n=1 Tax=Nakamurella leprariae TaxID=2803911 RepID=A0A938Y4X1_9ACTN|nr:hypothetical protein [Nakamurella leprariae]MBM9465810.1 hypothetical protein [Nakamurella leprariae]
MISSPARRRRVDRLVAAGLAVAVLAVAAVVWLTSDIRATTLRAGGVVPIPELPSQVPTALTERWELGTDARLGAVASPYGVVVTASEHAVTGWDATTGTSRWSYERSNRSLCTVRSGDVDTPGATVAGQVRGIAAVFEVGDHCSQVQLLDPVTGERTYSRTGPYQPGGALAFGGPYAGWIGPTLVEVWRNDLVRTIQYGDQPQPTKPGSSRNGCLFTDIALADTQFATVEHCSTGTQASPNARLVINWATPGSAPDKPSDQDVFKHTPRADIDTGSPAARIVGITADRVAVLVSAPEPAVVVYDAAGTETSRTPVPVPAAAIVQADVLPTTPEQVAAGATEVPVAITPATEAGPVRYSLVGDVVLAVARDQVQAPAPATTAATTPSTEPSTSATASSVAPGAALPGAAEATVATDDLQVRWTRSGALGTPATVAGSVLVPTAGGYDVVPAGWTGGVSRLGSLDEATGTPVSSIPVVRGDGAGRVDAVAVGSMVIEDRGATVVGLSP